MSSSYTMSSSAAVASAAVDETIVGAVLKHKMPVAMLNPHCALVVHRLQTIMNCAKVNEERLRHFVDSLGRSDDYATVYCAVNAANEEPTLLDQLGPIGEEMKRQLLTLSIMPAAAPGDGTKANENLEHVEEYLRALFLQLLDEIMHQCSEFKMVEEGMASDLIKRECLVYSLLDESNTLNEKQDVDFENAVKTGNNAMKELLSMCNRPLHLPKAPTDPEGGVCKSALAGWPLDLTQVKLNNDITLEDYMLGMHGCVLSAQMTDEELDKLLAVTKTALEKAVKMEEELKQFAEVMKWAREHLRQVCGDKVVVEPARAPGEKVEAPVLFDELAQPTLEEIIKVACELYRNGKFIKNCKAEQKSLNEYVDIIEDEGNIRLADVEQRAKVIEQEQKLLRTAVDSKREDIERLAAIERQLQDAIRHGMAMAEESAGDQGDQAQPKVNVDDEAKRARVQVKIQQVEEIKKQVAEEKRLLEAELAKRKTELEQVEREGEAQIAELQAKLNERNQELADWSRRVEATQAVNEKLSKTLELLDQDRVLKETTLRQLQVRQDLQIRLKGKRKAEALERKALLDQKKMNLENELNAIKEQKSTLEEERNGELRIERELDERIYNLQDELNRSRSDPIAAALGGPADVATMLGTAGVEDKSAKAIEEIVKNCTGKEDAAIRLGLEISRYHRQSEFFSVEIERNDKVLEKLLAKIEALTKRLAELDKK